MLESRSGLLTGGSSEPVLEVASGQLKMCRVHEGRAVQAIGASGELFLCSIYDEAVTWSHR